MQFSGLIYRCNNLQGTRLVSLWEYRTLCEQ